MKTLTLTLTLMAAGQATTAPADPAVNPADTQVQSVWDFVTKGGPMMVPIGVCSLIALAVIVERAVSLRRRNIIPPDFLSGVRGVLGDGAEDRAKAVEFCQANGSPIAGVFAAGIKRLGEPPERLEKHIEEAADREVLKMRKFTRLLSVIAAISPLMGLLGTIFGMINAFQTVASSAGALGRTELLAKGIYEALITTAAGLLVAIPALLGYHWISARIERLVSQIDQMTVEFFEEQPVGAAVATPAVEAKTPAAEPADVPATATPAVAG